MVDATIIISIVGPVLALLSLLMRANYPEVMAFMFALYVALATYYHAQPTVLPDGIRCPGFFLGGDILYGYEAQRSSDQINADFQECTQRVEDAAETVLLFWVAGGAIFIMCVVVARAERKNKRNQSDSS